MGSLLMSISLRALTVVCLVNVVASQSSRAQDQYEYPELAVTPRASARLEDEQKTEKSTAWTNYLPFQVSALATIYAGQMANSDPGKPSKGQNEIPAGEEPASKNAGRIATIVGGGWLGATLALSAVYRPYTTGVAAIAGMPNKTK